MLGGKPTLRQSILIAIATVIASIICLPFFVIQRCGFKMTRASRFLNKHGLLYLSVFAIRRHD